MIDEKTTAVITYVDGNYEENLENDFIYTLRERASYQGKIIVVDYGVEAEVRERISKKFDVDFHVCKKDMSVCALRYRDIPEIIDSLDESITNILVIDGGDVWFQKSIHELFEITKQRIGCVEEKMIFGEDEWVEKCMKNLDIKDRNRILSLAMGRHVKNSGMVCGPRHEVSKLIRNVCNDIYESGIEYFGIDQLFFNYEFLKIEDEEGVILDIDYNFVLITNKEAYYVEEDDVYCKKNNKLITVVHNAGGAWRMLKRPFQNKHTDVEQYILENVKCITH